MTKKTLIIWLSIVAILGTLGFVLLKGNNVPQGTMSARDAYAESKKIHGYAEYDVLEAKKLLAEKEKIEEEARLKVQADREKLGTGSFQ